MMLQISKHLEVGYIKTTIIKWSEYTLMRNKYDRSEDVIANSNIQASPSKYASAW